MSKVSHNTITLIVILSSITMTLLLLRKNCISLYQSSNFIQLLSNHFRSETMLFNITIYCQVQFIQEGKSLCDWPSDVQSV